MSGLAYLMLGELAGRRPDRWERKAFRTVNHNGGHLSVLRIPQQLGTPWVLPGTAAVAFLTSRPFLVVTAGLAVPVEKTLEVVTKKWWQRLRPAKAGDQVRLRDDAPTTGPSYPSGHAALATAVVVLTQPYLPAPVTGVLAAAAGGTTITRVHQGAHYPLDAVGGVLLGLAVGCGLTAAFGLPRRDLRWWTR